MHLKLTVPSFVAFSLLPLFSPAPAAEARLHGSLPRYRDLMSSKPAANSWSLPANFTDWSPWGSTLSWSSGKNNVQILTSGVPDSAYGPSSNKTNGSVIQIDYPAGSRNPQHSPIGGSQFYASPIDLSTAKNVTFSYDVFFPNGFNWVKGGKLPGLYGGAKGCSGGNAATDCFSTRLMWRQDGAGELYLYADQSKQVPALCDVPPKTVCDPSYGDSIARGSWTFNNGSWSSVRQDIKLNSSPDKADGAFNLWFENEMVATFDQVYYTSGAGFAGIFFSTFFGGSDSTYQTPTDQKVYFSSFELVINE